MQLRRKKRIIAASVVVLSSCLIVSLILYALNRSVNLFYLPSEILQGKDFDVNLKPKIGETLKVGGMVAFGSVFRDSDNLNVTFKISDNFKDFVSVSYKGLLPDLFKEGQGVIAKGILKADGLVVATEVLAKHDENYVPRELQDIPAMTSSFD